MNRLYCPVILLHKTLYFSPEQQQHIRHAAKISRDTKTCLTRIIHVVCLIVPASTFTPFPLNFLTLFKIFLVSSQLSIPSVSSSQSYPSFSHFIWEVIWKEGHNFLLQRPPKNKKNHLYITVLLWGNKYNYGIQKEVILPSLSEKWWSGTLLKTARRRRLCTCSQH